MIDYKMEELIFVAADLTKKYTSNESSSIPYEKAKMLMAAVTYCIEEYFKAEPGEAQECQDSSLSTTRNPVDARTAYEEGYRCVIEKVHRTKALYERITADFSAFGCLNCSDTMMKGIPSFFIWYDARFKPQDHLLTLDYPTMRTVRRLCGVDAIYQYLANIEMEWTFLRAFPEQSVIGLLDRVMPDYEELFFDNICSIVLRNAVGCVIANKPIFPLEILNSDLQRIESFFQGKSKEQIAATLDQLLDTIILHGYENNDFLSDYLKADVQDLTFIIDDAVRNHRLENVFIMK